MLIRALIAAVVALASPALAQTMVAPESLPQGFILIVKDNSGLSSAASPLYVASNWSGWAPGDAAYKMTSRSDMRWQIILKSPTKEVQPLQFKITRGSWEMCEVAGTLADIQNRTLAPIDSSKLKAGEQPVIELVVEKFSDQRPESQAKKAVDPYRSVRAMGSVKRLSVVGGGVPGQFRDALVWLPPGYSDSSNAGKSYPVLYLQDGQNLFEALPGTPGEWGADETATQLVMSGQIEPLIIVGIPHSGGQRVSEYLPVTGIGEVKPGGDDYVKFLIDEVIPRVERTFRVKADAENRAIGGSSLGGLVSLYAATKRPDVFGKVLVESPSLSLGKKDIGKELFSSVKVWPRRVYIGMGGHESGSDAEVSARYVKAAKDLDGWVGASGLSESQHKLLIDDEATHNEAAWAKRFPEALKFLFPAPK